jgi:hypothetical protein
MKLFDKDNNFSISRCDISDIIEETHRFIMHICLVHILTFTIEGKDELFGRELFRNLAVCVIAILAYHIFLKKLMLPKIKLIKNKCKGIKIKKDE